ncbi:hypothetical protein D3C75_1184480 [compost metagenome]
MGSRRYLAEQYTLIRKKQLDSENTESSKLIRHCSGDGLGFGQLRFTHVMRLPRLHIIAVLLDMANGRTEYRTAY